MPNVQGVARLALTDADVTALLSPAAAIDAVEGSLRRMARGVVDNRLRERLPFADGEFAVMACVDHELGVAGLKTYTWTSRGAAFVVLLFSLESGRCEAVLEADRLGELRTAAASAVAARHLAIEGASRLGLIGCGRQAAAHVACMRAVLSGLEQVVVSCPTAARRDAFCRLHDCEAAESNQQAADADVVVTATTATDPVLRGEWLRDGSLVCAIGANDPARRELDNAVIERASFVCCDSRAQAAREAGDLIEPVEQGLLDWLEVHELAAVVAGDLQGRGAPEDVVLFKSNGLAAWDVAAACAVVERARSLGVGREG